MLNPSCRPCTPAPSISRCSHCIQGPVRLALPGCPFTLADENEGKSASEAHGNESASTQRKGRTMGIKKLKTFFNFSSR